MDANIKTGAEKPVAVVNAGTETYAETLRKIELRGKCPFCPEHLTEEHSEAVIRRGNHWILTRNQFGYQNAEARFLLISLVHAERLADLPSGAAGEAWEMFQYLEREYGIDYGAIALRFGDPSKTGATVRHLHFHCIKPHDPAAPGYQPVRFRIGGRN